MTDKAAFIRQLPGHRQTDLNKGMKKSLNECQKLPLGNSKKSRSENSDTIMTNNLQSSSGSYESMRLLIERQERDLGELREFANLERESLQFHVLDQQERINSFLKIQSETQVRDTENCQNQDRVSSHNGRVGVHKVMSLAA